MRRLALINTVIVHEELIQPNQDPSVLNFEGYYDTLIDDPDKLFNVGDVYDITKFIEHYFPQSQQSGAIFNAPVL